MHIFLLFISNGLVIGGVGLLCLALIPIHRFICQLPDGKLKQRWKALRFLILFLISGYIAYAVMSWGELQGAAAMMVPMILFSGAIFVLMVGKLILKTTSDVKKMADLECENIIDPLTGTHNRRHLDRCLSNEMDRARRYWLPLSLMMFDIDYFKKVNDAHGQQVGDLVLMHVGRLILDAVRNIDIVARFRGDEFVIITPHTRLPDAQELAERLRHKVETTPFVLSDAGSNGNALNITVSAGVSALFEGVTDGKALIRMADEALYMAKKRGCNQVVVCDQSVGMGADFNVSASLR